MMVVRYYTYFKQYPDLLENYPGVCSIMRVAGDEVLIQFKTSCDSIEVRRLKVDSDHFIQIDYVD